MPKGWDALRWGYLDLSARQEVQGKAEPLERRRALIYRWVSCSGLWKVPPPGGDGRGPGQFRVGGGFELPSWLRLGLCCSTHKISEVEPGRDGKTMDGLPQESSKGKLMKTKDPVCETKALLNTHSKSRQVPRALSENLVRGFLPVECKARCNRESQLGLVLTPFLPPPSS